MKNKNGFTLIEIIAVIVIIGVLLLIAIPAVSSIIFSSRDKTYVNNISSYMTEAELNYKEKRYGPLLDKGEIMVVPIKDITFSKNNNQSSPYAGYDLTNSYILITKSGYGYKVYSSIIDESNRGVFEVSNETINANDIKIQAKEMYPNLKDLFTCTGCQCEVSNTVFDFAGKKYRPAETREDKDNKCEEGTEDFYPIIVLYDVTESSGDPTPNPDPNPDPGPTSTEYSIRYELDGGTSGSNHPETAGFDDEITIDNPTKTITAKFVNDVGATVSSMNDITRNYTFTGWDIIGMDNTTHFYGANTSTENTLSGVTSTTFKHLRGTAGAVTFSSKWHPPTIKLPDIIYTGGECNWVSGTYTWSSGANYTPKAENGVTERTFTVECVPRVVTITLDNQGATTSGTATIYEKHNVGWFSNSSATTSITEITKPKKTGYTFGGYYTSTGAAGTQIINANGQIIADSKFFNSDTTIYASWGGGNYSLSYDLDGGDYGTNHPTTAFYDSQITIDNPTKQITAKFEKGSSGMSTKPSDITKPYTFNGWNISEMDSSTHFYGISSTTDTVLSGIKATTFKHLRGSAGTVEFAATWIAPSITLPTISVVGHICKWTSPKSGGGNYEWASGDTYYPQDVNGATTRTFTAECVPRVYTITLNNQSADTAGTSKIYEKYGTGWYSNSTASTSISSITKPSKTGYTFGGYYTSTNGGGIQVIDSSGKIVASNTQFASNNTIYALWGGGNYSISYELDSGSYGSSHPTSADYDQEITINNPSKQVTATFAKGSTGITVPSDITANYTFNGWNITGMDSSTHYYGASSASTSTTNTSLNDIKATKFKHLRGTSGTVTFTAKWTAPSITLPTISKTGYSCNWTSVVEGTKKYWSGGDTYTPKSEGGLTSRTFTAECTANIYTITLNNKSADTAGTAKIYEKYGSGWYSNSTASTSISSITKPSKTGYVFSGYYTGENGTGTQIIDSSGNIIASNTKFTSSTTIYALWGGGNYSISYALDGGSDGSSHPTSADYDQEITINNPTKKVTATFAKGSTGITVPSDIAANYTFDGWSISGMDSTTHYYGSSSASTSTTNTSLSGIKVTKFKHLRGTSGTVSFTAKWTAPSITLPAVTKTGHSCKWTSTVEGTKKEWNGGDTYTPKSEGGVTSRTFTAECTPNIYTITLNNQSADTAGTSIIYEKYGVGWYSNSSATTSMSSITKPEKTGDNFGGYYTETSGGGSNIIDSSGKIVASNTKFTSNTTIYASWITPSYTLTYNPNGSTDNTQTQTVKYGDTWKTKGAIYTKSGQTLMAWYDSSKWYKLNTTQSAWEWTSNHTINAKWCDNCEYVADGSCSLSWSSNKCTYTTSCDTNYTLVDGSGTKSPKCCKKCDTVANGTCTPKWENSKCAYTTSCNSGYTIVIGNNTSSPKCCKSCSNVDNGSCSVTWSDNKCTYNTTCNSGYTLVSGNSSSDPKCCKSCSKVDNGSCSVTWSDNKCTYNTTCNSGYTLTSGGGTSSPVCTKNTSKPKATITCHNKYYNEGKQTIAECEGGTISGAEQTTIGTHTINCTGDSSHSDADPVTCEIYDSVAINTYNSVSTGFGSLSEAISYSKVAPNGTVKLLKNTIEDVGVSVTIVKTIDLNGKTVTGTFTNNGKITLKGNGTIKSNGSNTKNLISNFGTLSIQNGTFINNPSGMTDTSTIVNSNGSLEIWGGTFTNNSNSSQAVAIKNNAPLGIHGGTFKAPTNQEKSAALNNMAGDCVIKGGTFSGYAGIIISNVGVTVDNAYINGTQYGIWVTSGISSYNFSNLKSLTGTHLIKNDQSNPVYIYNSHLGPVGDNVTGKKSKITGKVILINLYEKGENGWYDVYAFGYGKPNSIKISPLKDPNQELPIIHNSAEYGGTGYLVNLYKKDLQQLNSVKAVYSLVNVGSLTYTFNYVDAS